MRPTPLIRRAADDPYVDIRDPRVHRTVEVFEAEDPWIDTGLLDANGEPIRYYTGPNPVGFLWDAPRGRPNRRPRRGAKPR